MELKEVKEVTKETEFKGLKLILFVILFLIGMLMVFNAGKWGIAIAQRELVKVGSMDTARYVRLQDINIEKFKSVGYILSVFGGLGILFDMYFRKK